MTKQKSKGQKQRYFSILDKPIEAPENEQELWKEYKRTHCPKIRERFVIQYHPLVKYVAGKVAMGMPQTIEFDDLVGYGVFGLLDAIEKYDPSRDIKFKTYAVTRIRGAIYDELRKIDQTPRSVRHNTKVLEEVYYDLENEGKKINYVNVAKELDITEEEAKKMMCECENMSAIISINDIWYLGDDNDKVSVIDTIKSSESVEPHNIAEKKLFCEAINSFVKQRGLSLREKIVIESYYQNGFCLREIGEVLNVTESRVSQLHTMACKKLWKLKEIMKDFFE